MRRSDESQNGRKLVWIEQQRFRGWGCSECAWAVSPSGAPGNFFDDNDAEL
jgi:hypothetical protein